MGTVSILRANEGDTFTLYGRASGAGAVLDDLARPAAEQDTRRHLHRDLTDHSERRSGCSIAQHDNRAPSGWGIDRPNDGVLIGAGFGPVAGIGTGESL